MKIKKFEKEKEIVIQCDENLNKIEKFLQVFNT